MSFAKLFDETKMKLKSSHRRNRGDEVISTGTNEPINQSIGCTPCSETRKSRSEKTISNENSLLNYPGSVTKKRRRNRKNKSLVKENDERKKAKKSQPSHNSLDADDLESGRNFGRTTGITPTPGTKKCRIEKSIQDDNIRTRNQASASNKRRRNRNNDDKINEHNVKKKARKESLSQDAIELGRKLQELSRQKRLEEAISLYWDEKHNFIRDSHNACVLIDCCARCGDVESAELVVQKLDSEKINTEINTALIKGYSHSGNILKAMQLFRRITEKSVPIEQRPNVRTLNTLLRGCLWTAASLDRNGNVVGGVVTAEEAWRLYCMQSDNAADSLDVSSFEYFICLLCQSLRTDEAQTRINAFRELNGVQLKGKATISGGNQSVLEALGVMYLALARSFALMGRSEDMWIAAQRSLSAVRSSRSLLTQSENGDDRVDNVVSNDKKSKVAVGGKRSWKKDSLDNPKDSLRTASNYAYRAHRLSELEAEGIELLKLRSTVSVLPRKVLAEHLMKKLLYFSGAGSTDRLAVQGMPKNFENTDRSTTKKHCLTSAWHSFGLSKIADIENSSFYTKNSLEVNIKMLCDGFKIPSYDPFDESGRLNLGHVFGDSNRPLDIEVGAGFGSWIVNQAQRNLSRNYLAIELRADRLFQIFARSVLHCENPLANLCIVGSECGDFVRKRLKKCCVSTVFVNYPEPPTQTFGDDRNNLQSIIAGGAEPVHMLHSNTIKELASCLKRDGRMIVVTDNKWYARLLAATFSRVIQEDSSQLRSLSFHELIGSSLRLSESFAGSVCLFQGQPSREIGHSMEDNGHGASYFDRLWKTGAGSHAEKKNRFVLIMSRSTCS